MSDFWKLKSRIIYNLTQEDLKDRIDINSDKTYSFSRTSTFTIGNYYFNYALDVITTYGDSSRNTLRLFLNISLGDFAINKIRYNDFNFIALNLNEFIHNIDNQVPYKFEVYHNAKFDYYKLEIWSFQKKSRTITFRLSEEKELTSLNNLENINLIENLLKKKYQLKS